MRPSRRRSRNARGNSRAHAAPPRARGRSSRAGRPRNRRTPARAIDRARDAGRAAGLPSRLIASWNPPWTRSAPTSHHSGSATSNSQRRSAAASVAISLMRPSHERGLARRPHWRQRARDHDLLEGSWHFSFYTARSGVEPSANRRRGRLDSRAGKDEACQAPVLVTGAAGFIGMHVARRLLADGNDVVGLDNLNAYYDPRLKEARLAELKASSELPVREHRHRRPQGDGGRCLRRIAFRMSSISRRKPACGIR